MMIIERIKNLIKYNGFNLFKTILAILLPILIIYLAYKLSIYVMGGRSPSIIFNLSLTFGIFGILSFLYINLNNIIMRIYRQILNQKLLDNNGIFVDEKNRITYYEKITEFRKYSYWNHSIIAFITFLILYPIFKKLNESYYFLIILFSSLAYDFYLRKFSLEWARKTNFKTTHLYSKRYWKKSYWEDFLSSFLQLFLTPILIFGFFHFDIILYDTNLPSLFYLFGYVVSFISLFGFIFYITPVLVFLLPAKGKSRLEGVYEWYESFLPNYF